MDSENAVDPGVFSISLTVKDIAVSRTFYEKLGFRIIGGEQEQKWLVLQNGDAYVGLFQDMFEKNILTFNPTDVRSIQKHLRSEGIELIETADEESTGAAHITLEDPDGNPILFDQFESDHPAMRRKEGKAAWVDMTVDDAPGLRDFYAEVVGWKPEPVAMEGYDDYSMTAPDGTPVTGICHRRGPNADLPTGWIVYFTVPDLDSALAACEKRGGTIVSRTARDNAAEGFAIIRDPAGTISALYQS